jgi:hydrogenase maturation protease
MPRILVAGIGNIFLGDDGFGVEVVRRLSAQTPREDIDVVDFGIRGVHLAYELSEGKYDAAILVDATPRGGEPGTLYAIEPDPSEADGETGDAHSMTPAVVLDWVRRTGGRCGRVLVVGCEPASLDESMGLSDVVARSVEPAMEMVCRLAAGLRECESCA